MRLRPDGGRVISGDGWGRAWAIVALQATVIVLVISALQSLR